MLNEEYLVECHWNHRNKKWYEGKGYTFTVYSDVFYVNPRDLTLTSSQYVEVICDYCGERFLQKYVCFLAHKENINKDACKRCCSKKLKEVTLMLYGVENVSQLDEIKEQKKQTCLEHYGVETPLQSKEIQEKVKKTNIERYGCEYIMQSNDMMQKSIDTCIRKYGVKYSLQSEEVRAKGQQTIFQKYGVLNVFQNEKIKEKIRETNIERYGVSSYTKTEEYLEKRKNTCLERYGVEHSSQNPKIAEKIVQSFYKNGTIKTSFQQKMVCKLLENIYGNCELNKPCGLCFLDCVVNINGVLIDVEYDGSYWHQDEQKDRRRDEFVKSQGYKILRIIGGRNVPSKEQLQDAINNLLLKNNNFYKISI